MHSRSRRELIADVGTGMVAASLGAALAADLGFRRAYAADGPARLTFGDLDPLVNLLRDTPPERLVGLVVGELKAGTTLRKLVAAAALTNARAFGGDDYVGFHTLMALAPAFQMAEAEPDPARKPLAVIKVLHRNAARLGEVGHEAEALVPVEAGRLEADKRAGEQLRDQVRAKDKAAAERTFEAVCRDKPADALNELLVAVDDATEVHRVVLVSRAWDLTRFVGTERAGVMLRQSVRYCVNAERSTNHAQHNAALRAQLPALLDQYKLLGRTPGTRVADDGWVANLADTLFRSDPATAADAVAAALAEGMDAEAIGEAISLAANQLVLRDPGRPAEWARPNKPVGSVHGDSVGVHGCDTVHAWRSLARAGDRRTQVTSLILAGYQVARDRAGRPNLLDHQPHPRPEQTSAVSSLPADRLRQELVAAIRNRDQMRAVALASRIGTEAPESAAPVIELLRGYAVSEDGALHAEKFFATATDEFARTRPVFRWRHLVALARVTASAFGDLAPAHKEACDRLGVKA